MDMPDMPSGGYGVGSVGYIHRRLVPSISFVDAVERACCTRPVIDLASVEHERDRPAGGEDRGGAGAAAARAAQDAARQAGAFGGLPSGPPRWVRVGRHLMAVVTRRGGAGEERAAGRL